MRRAISFPTKPLLRRSPLLPGESLPSLLARLTLLNGYSSPSVLGRLYRSDHSVWLKHPPLKNENFDRLEILTGIPTAELWSASEYCLFQKVGDCNCLGESFPLWIMMVHSTQAAWYCPKCLTEAAYHRLIWSPVSSAVCLKHACLLMNDCPQCHHSVTVDDLVRVRCHTCLTDLRRIPPITFKMSENEKMAQMALQGLRTGYFTPHPSWPQQPPMTLCCLADGFALGIAYLSKHGFPHSNIPNLSCKAHSIRDLLQHLSPIQVLQAYTMAIQCILDWPEGFRRFLYWCEPNPKQELGKRVKALIGFLATKLWSSDPFRFVWNAFWIFDGDRLNFISGFAVREMTFEQLPAYASADEAAHILDISEDALFSLVENNFLSPTQIWRKNSCQLFFRRADLRTWSQNPNRFCLTISETQSHYI